MTYFPVNDCWKSPRVSGDANMQTLTLVLSRVTCRASKGAVHHLEGRGKQDYSSAPANHNKSRGISQWR